MYFYEDSDDNDSDWEPLQEPTAVAKWFCVNCTMVNFEDVVHCDICGEHRESEIITHGVFASPLNGIPGSNSKVQDSCLQDLTLDKSTAVGFDERMLLHSEVEKKAHPHPERPDRLRAIAASLATAGIFPGKCFAIPSREITREELKMIHSLENIDAVELSSRMYASYFASDTYANKHSALAARLAAGLCADLASTIFSGRVKNGFALVRPPGHHAGVKQAMGFCLHNNAAVAASAAQMAGAKRVLIVDWDVHHGNGTQEIFEQNKSVLYISLHRHEGGKFYPGTGAAAEVGTMGAEGHCVNVPWSRGGVGDNDYIFAFQQVVLPIASEYAPEFTIISAGFDAARGDPLGGCDVTPAGYGQMTEMLITLSRGKLLVILEGGYNLRSLSSSATEVIKVLLGERHGCKLDNVVPTRAGLRNVLEVLKIQRIYWPTLKPIISNILSKWGVHIQERRKMVELPFSENPFSKPKDETPTKQARPVTSFIAGQTLPPQQPYDRAKKRSRKRTGVAVDAGKGDASKKNKHTVVDLPENAVATAFGSLAAVNFSTEDVKLWSGRSEAESEYAFRQGLGEAFFHGLGLLAAKNAKIAELDRSIKKHRDAASLHKQQLADVQKKVSEDMDAKKKELDRLQTALDKVSTDAKKMGEDHAMKLSKVKAELDRYKVNRNKDLSDAYTQGFFGCLKGFLGAHFDYDWSIHFAPSTPHYIAKFKVDNAQAIEEERTRNEAKIRAELEKIATDERSKQEASKTHPGDENNEEASPSNTVSS